MLWYSVHLTAERLDCIIKHASDSAPGPDGVTYDHLKSLNEEELGVIADVLRERVEESQIPDDRLDSHLGPISKPRKDLSSIKGYRIITMQNIIGNLFEKMVAYEKAEELEAKELLSPTLDSYMRGKET